MAKSLISELILQIKAEMDGSFGGTMEKIKNNTEKLQGYADAAAMSFSGLAAGIAGVGAVLVKTAAQYEQYQATLLAVTHSQEETNELMAMARQMAPTSPFAVGDIVKATVHLRAMNVDVKKNIDLAANLASAFGTDLATATNAIGKAAVGSAEGYEILRNQFGITTQELAKFGAMTKDGNQLIMSQSGAIERNREALHSLIQSKFGTAISLQMDTVNTALSNFGDAVETISAKIGEQLLPDIKMLTGAATGLATSLNNPAFAGFAAQGIRMGVALTGAAAGVGILASAVLRVLDTVTKLKAVGLASQFSAIIPVAALAAVSINAVVQSYENLNRLKEESIRLTAIEQKDILEDKRRWDALRKFHEGERDLTKEEIADAIAANQIKISEQRKLADEQGKTITKVTQDERGKITELVYVYGEKGRKQAEWHRQRITEFEKENLALHQMGVTAKHALKEAGDSQNAVLTDWDKAIQKMDKSMEDLANVAARGHAKDLKAAAKGWGDAQKEMEKSMTAAHREGVAERKREDDRAAAEAKRTLEERAAAEKSTRNEILDLKEGIAGDEVKTLQEQLDNGEDVQDKLRAKIQERAGYELQKIDDVQREMESQGISRELIEEKIALLKKKAFGDEISQIDQILGKTQEVAKANEEAFSPGRIAKFSSSDTQAIQDYLSPFRRGSEEAGLASIQATVPAPTNALASLRNSVMAQMANVKDIKTGLPMTSPIMAKGGANIGAINVTLNIDGNKQSRAASGITAGVTNAGLTITIPRQQLQAEVGPLGSGAWGLGVNPG